MTGVALIVMAKAPEPGRSKTRLCPPCTPAEAAHLAEAALRDTLEAVAHVPVERRVIALDGPRGDWLSDRFEVVEQRGSGLAERLAHAFETVGAPAVAIGMDTPQVAPGALARAAEALGSDGADAVLGPAADGGYWALGLRRADSAVLAGVPMSTGRTAAEQRRRLRALGLRYRELETLRDFDTIEDACAVARQAPGTRFARALHSLGVANTTAA